MAFDDERLLAPPVARAAYSDRTAWMMAEMARLAYVKFELTDGGRQALAERLAALGSAEAIAPVLDEVRTTLAAGDPDGRSALDAGLDAAGFAVDDTFDGGGTQAFLAVRERDRMAVLAFRGTEKDFDDIKTDLNARFFHKDGARIHHGFHDAFEAVAPAVRSAVSRLAQDGYKIYITGHSLGGALALIAARALDSDQVAACYTFGSPKVGDSELGDAIKPPIYRIVNAADAVPRVPPTWLPEIAIALAWCIPLPYLRKAVLAVAMNFRGYRHHGDMRYLTACAEDCADLRVIPNLNIVLRTVRLVRRLSVNWKAGFADHRMAEYCNKLKAYAIRRLDA